MSPSVDDSTSLRVGHAVVLLGVAALALAVRCLGFEYVFVGEEIVFPPADPQYHLRRALYTLANLPGALLFDTYINHPGGAPVPWPPLYDFSLGFFGWLCGGTPIDLERVAAWSGPFCAAIAVVPIHLSGRLLVSRRVGLVASLFFALLPISVAYTRIGNADHHAAVAMLGAWLLYAVLGLVDPEASRRRMIAFGGLLFAASTSLVLTWHGSLLYLLPAEGLLVLSAVLTGRRSLLAVQAISAIGSAAVVAAMLAVSPEPLGGPYSAIALSWLHALALVGVAVVTGGTALGMQIGRAPGVPGRAMWAFGLGLAFLIGVVILPGAREGLEPAIRFLGLEDEVGAVTGEQSPLFAIGRRAPGRSALHTWGAVAYLLPLLPLAGLIVGRGAGRRTGARAAGLLLFAWGLVFCTLAVLQRRYGNDAAPAASLLVAIALCAGIDRVVRAVRTPVRLRGFVAGALAVLVLVAGFWSVIDQVYAPRFRSSWATWRTPGNDWPAARGSIAFTLHAFLGEVRRATPETSGYLDGSEAPEYGVIAHANLGHAIQYPARRATATDPFWWYIGRENWERSFDFIEATDEQVALERARELAGRYVITMPDAAPGTVMARLHDGDGTGAGDRTPLHHFRLVTEAPPGGPSIAAIFGGGPSAGSPYKLFEIVPGALVEVPTEPGQAVVISATVETPVGRRFNYQLTGRADDDGVVRFRVPYATSFSGGTDAEKPVAHAVGSYRVRDGMRLRALHVPEEAVVRGETISVDRSLGAPFPDASILRR